MASGFCAPTIILIVVYAINLALIAYHYSKGRTESNKEVLQKIAVRGAIFNTVIALILVGLSYYMCTLGGSLASWVLLLAPLGVFIIILLALKFVITPDIVNEMQAAAINAPHVTDVPPSHVSTPVHSPQKKESFALNYMDDPQLNNYTQTG